MRLFQRASLVMSATLVVALVVPVGALGASAMHPSPADSGAAAALSLPLSAPFQAAIVPATAVETATIVETWDVSAVDPPSIDPAGIVYLSHTGELLVSDSEVDEEPTVYEGANMFFFTLQGALLSTSESPDTPLEPTGLTYDPASRHVFISNDSEDIYEVDPGVDGEYFTADDAVTSFDTAAFGSFDPEDVAFDPVSGDLFIADGVHAQVFRVDPGPNGVFEGVAGDDVISSFDVGADGVDDAEGLGFRAVTRTLLVVDAGSDESIFEYTLDGFLLRRISLSAIKLVGVPETPSDVAVAPASDGSAASHLYLTDRKADNGNPNDGIPPPMDGTIYELAVPFADLAPYVDAGADATVTGSAGAVLSGFAVDDGQPTLDPVVVTWTKVSGPGSVTFSAPSSASTAASFSVAGAYVLELAGSDGNATTTDQVTVTVLDDTGGNTAPTVDAGGDQTVILRDGALLAGSASDDGLPDPPRTLTYQWTKKTGPGQVQFTAATSPSTSASFGTIGTYDLELAVSDGQLTTRDVLRVIVEPNPPGTIECDGVAFSSAGFVDLGGLSDEAIDAVDCLATRDITRGTGADTYTPYGEVTRWQMALFLTRQAAAEGLVLPSGADQGFVDIGHLNTATQTAINQLAQMGVTLGTGPDSYSPSEDVSRWQMALFLTRLLDLVEPGLIAGGDAPFTDLDDMPPGVDEAVDRLWTLAVVRGTSDTTYDPLSSVARWQMALFLARLLDV